MSFLLKIENIAKSSKILLSEETFFLRSKDRSRTHDQKVNKILLTAGQAPASTLLVLKKQSSVIMSSGSSSALAWPIIK